MAAPTSTAEETDQVLKERHDELSKDIRKTALLVLSYSFFCFLALGQSDEVAVSETLRLQIPFANTGINPKTFLFIGPLILILLTSYLHIFIREWSKVSRVSTLGTLPYIFNLDFWFARILTVFTFYILPLIVLLSFASSTRAHPYFLYPYILVEVMAVVMLLCFLTHKNKFPRRFWKLFLINLTTLILVGGFCYAHFKYYYLVHKPLFLKYAKLSKNELSGYNLRRANLIEAELNRAVLIETDLTWANLEEAHLKGAHLKGAILFKANFKEADLEGANLRGANIRGASLKGAYLEGANLQEADLEGVDLEGANLRGANLKGAKNLSCKQINRMKSLDNHTQFPDYLEIKVTSLIKWTCKEVKKNNKQ